MTEFIRELESFLLSAGYRKLADQNGFGASWVRDTEGVLAMISLVFEELPGQKRIPVADKLEELARDKNRVMIQTSRQVDQLFLLVKKSNPSGAEIRQVQEYKNLWFLDQEDGQVLIYENQVTDFYGIRAGLENFMETMRIRKEGSDRTDMLRTFTPVNTVLVACNVLVFAWLSLQGDTESAGLIERYGGMTWDRVVNHHEYYRIIASMFLHFGPVHLMQNMLILLVTGSRLERIVGRLRYILIYFFSGITSAAASLAFTLAVSPGAVAAGASGAIFGVLGGLLALILTDLAGGQKKRVREIGPVGILFMIGSALYYGFSSTGVDNAAHVGGLIGGLVLTFLIGRGTDRSQDL